MPPQDRVRANKRQEATQLVHREMVKQASEHGAVGIDEDGPGDLALQYQQLMPEREDLDVLLSVAHGRSRSSAKVLVAAR